MAIGDGLCYCLVRLRFDSVPLLRKKIYSSIETNIQIEHCLYELSRQKSKNAWKTEAWFFISWRSNHNCPEHFNRLNEVDD